MAKKTRIEKRNIVNSNTIHTIELGFAADQTALTTNRSPRITNPILRLKILSVRVSITSIMRSPMPMAVL